MDIKKDTARVIQFLLVNATDKVTPETGLSTGFTVNLTKAGVRSAWSGTITEVDAANVPGVYYLTLSTSDTDTEGDLWVHVSHASCQTQIMTFNVVDYVDAALTTASLNSVAAYVLTASIEDIYDDWDAASGEGTDPGDADDRNRDHLGTVILMIAGQASSVVNGANVDLKFWLPSQNKSTEDPQVVVTATPGDSSTYPLTERA